MASNGPTGGIACPGRWRMARRWRLAVAFAPLLGLAAFIAYVAPTAWLQAEQAPIPAAPPAGCALLLGYMAWPIGLAACRGRRRRYPPYLASVAAASSAPNSSLQSSISAISMSFSNSSSKRCTIASGSFTRLPSPITPKCTRPL